MQNTEREKPNVWQAAEALRSDLSKLKGHLETWWASVSKDGEKPELVNLRRPQGAGTSSETILATLNWPENTTPSQDVVFRIQPHGFQLHLNPVFKLQFDAMKALSDLQTVKVPQALYFEENSEILGHPFFVMSQLHGNVPVSSPPYTKEGWLYDASPAQRQKVWYSAVEGLCSIANIEANDITFLDKPESGQTGLQQELDHWRRFMPWATGGKEPDLLLELFDWLVRHKPTEKEDGLSWGDARIGNMMFGEDFTLSGIMDWEQANLGGSRQDLGWWLYFDEYYSKWHGHSRLDGMGSRADTLSLWRELTGDDGGDQRWYEVFAGYKVALFTVKSYQVMQNDAATDISLNTALLYTCELAGITPKSDRLWS